MPGAVYLGSLLQGATSRACPLTQRFDCGRIPSYAVTVIVQPCPAGQVPIALGSERLATSKYGVQPQVAAPFRVVASLALGPAVNGV